MTTWKQLLTYAMEEYGETLADLVSITLTEDEMTREFDADGHRWLNGVPFTAWTSNRVYFPIQYDYEESVGSVARNPDGMPTLHQGG